MDDHNSADVYISVITVAEFETGVARSRCNRAHANATRLANWLETCRNLFGSRILSIDVQTARRIVLLADQARGQRHDPELANLAITATATTRAT